MNLCLVYISYHEYATAHELEMNERPRQLLDQMRDIIRVKHYSIRTEQAYVGWARRYILFHDKRHPREMGAPEIAAFLTHLAVDQNVAASTQNQALCALLFLYRTVLGFGLWSACIYGSRTWILPITRSSCAMARGNSRHTAPPIILSFEP